MGIGLRVVGRNSMWSTYRNTSSNIVIPRLTFSASNLRAEDYGEVWRRGVIAKQEESHPEDHFLCEQPADGVGVCGGCGVWVWRFGRRTTVLPQAGFI